MRAILNSKLVQSSCLLPDVSRCSRITYLTFRHTNRAGIQLLTIGVHQNFVDALLDLTNVFVFVKFATGKYFQCESGRVVNIAAL